MNGQAPLAVSNGCSWPLSLNLICEMLGGEVWIEPQFLPRHALPLLSSRRAS